MKRLRTAVLISGRGTNLQALIDACADPSFPAELCLVISNRPGAAGLRRAEDAGIETRVVDHKAFPDRRSFEAALDEALRGATAEFVCSAGFMRVLTEWFVERWRDRQINIHPSLLPDFPGLDSHARALAAGVREAGCSVHFVRTEVDAGPIIVQAAVPVLAGDDENALAARVLAAEHEIYPLALRLIGEGRVDVVDEVVHIDGAPAERGLRIGGED